MNLGYQCAPKYGYSYNKKVYIKGICLVEALMVHCVLAFDVRGTSLNTHYLKFRAIERCVWCQNYYRIALTFGRQLDSFAAEMPVNFQSDRSRLTHFWRLRNVAESGFKISYRLVNSGPCVAFTCNVNTCGKIKSIASSSNQRRPAPSSIEW